MKDREIKTHTIPVVFKQFTFEKIPVESNKIPQEKLKTIKKTKLIANKACQECKNSP